MLYKLLTEEVTAMTSTSREDDPLNLVGLEPAVIEQAVKGRGKKAPNELDKLKEERLIAKEKRLAGPAPAPTDSSKTTALPAEPTKEPDKSLLLDKLHAYRERFPHLKKRNNVTVKSSAEDILDELHFVELQLGSKQDGTLGGMLLHGTMVAVETLTRDVYNPLNLRLDGIAQVTKDNMAEFQPILDELMIKYGAGMYMRPETRLVLAMGALIVTVHSANSGNPKVASALQRMNASVKVNTAHNDL